MHFHRDLLAVADTYGRYVLQPRPDDIFIGSPPLAFTYALGGLVLFPMRFGASTALLGQATPPLMLEGIQNYRATVTVTSPTGYRAMLRAGRRVRPDQPAPLHLGRRDAAGGGVRRLGRGHRHPADGRHRLDRDAPHVHRLHGRRGAPGIDRPDRARLPGHGRRRHRRRSAPRHHRPPRRLRTDRLPLSRRSREPAALRAARLEPDRRRLPPGRRRLLLVPVAHRRHDRLVGLQHRRRRGGERAPHRALRRRVRGGRRARRGARPDRQGLRRRCRRGGALGRAGQDPAGLRQVADRARTSTRARSSSWRRCRGR